MKSRIRMAMRWDVERRTTVELAHGEIRSSRRVERAYQTGVIAWNEESAVDVHRVTSHAAVRRAARLSAVTMVMV